MSDEWPWGQPWSDHPNAPKIPDIIYLCEKAWLAGDFISLMLYGIVVTLFFKCMAALFNADYRRGEPIKWGLVSYTAAMFSVVTIGTAIQLAIQSSSFIDNRAFPGVDGVIFFGPYGYQRFINPKAISVVRDVMFTLDSWMADGLLLYRCYIIYSMNRWVIALPCLMYLGSLAMGTALVYQYTHITIDDNWSALPYFSISLSLNALLTLMIIIRLVLHTRNTRTALGMTGIGGFCKAIITMLVESCALFGVSSLLVIAALGSGSRLWNLFTPILTETQVIAPFLIILRVADKSALTSDTVVSGRISGFKARSRRELTGGGDDLSIEDSTTFTDGRVTKSHELGFGVQTLVIDFHQDKI